MTKKPAKEKTDRELADFMLSGASAGYLTVRERQRIHAALEFVIKSGCTTLADQR